jgi:hypothetical protein
VGDDIAEVDQNPAAVGVALGTGDRKAILPHRIRDRIGDRAGLNFRAAGDDDERIGNDGPALEVQDGDILAFLVFGGGADDVDEFRQSVSPGAVWVRSGRGRLGFAVTG